MRPPFVLLRLFIKYRIRRSGQTNFACGSGCARRAGCAG